MYNIQNQISWSQIMSEEKEELIVEFCKVNKFDSVNGWLAKTLFDDYKYRIKLRYCDTLIGSLTRLGKLRHKLNTEIGEENERWFAVNDGKNEWIYLKDNAIVLTWKITSPEDFKQWFEKVEHHTTDENILLQQELDNQNLTIGELTK
jgi:hypothetical protein